MDETKRKELATIYKENIKEAFTATKETGVYIHCEYAVDLKENSVRHSLSSTNGTDVVIIQNDIFSYDTKFKKEFIEPSLVDYASNGVVTVLKAHNHTVDPTPDNSSSLKTVSSMNNIVSIKNAEIEYIERLSTGIQRIQGKNEGKKLLLNNKANGIINAFILAFLVGLFDGTIMMLILNYIMKNV